MNGNLFSAINFKLLGLSVGLLVVGYILLGQGPVYNPLSWSVAPVILVAVYCILLPVSIMARDRKKPAPKKK
jgi:hypothetical protein